jgi:class 3 adenylate cyclase
MDIVLTRQYAGDPSRYLAYVYFALAVLILTVYGTRISPYLGQPEYISFFSYAIPFSLIAVLKYLLEPLLVGRVDVLLRPRRQFWFDLALYFLVSLIIFALHVILYTQPAGLAIKMIIGTIIIGYFASIDNTLCKERFWFTHNKHATREEFRFSPLSNKLSLFLTITMFIGMTITGLVAYIDLGHFALNTNLDKDTIMQVFMVDIFFVFGIILIFTLRLIHSYSMNMQHIFTTQLDVLRNVQSGDYTEYVPIVTRDEFGLIARQINTMIDGLRDKEHLRQTLERIVSPSIMEKLLTTDDKTLKYGQEYDVAILFCDLREFTRFSEQSSAEDVIFFLNAYFSQMVKIVSANRGIINKFMGDAVLAVYGLEESDTSVEDAVISSRTMLEHARNIMMPDGKHLDIGIGIHAGRVVAGTIGSDERYEYTFIGDAVNTASRLDGLTKRLGYSIIISEDAHNALNETSKRLFTDLGMQVVRGKEEPVHVYGASAFKQDVNNVEKFEAS